MDADPALPGLEQMPPEDQIAIGETLVSLFQGFAQRDVAMLDGVYAEDADWLNAFGTRKRGRVAIVAYLRGLFADANFSQGEMIAPPESALRRLTETVVAVSSHLRIAGQGLAGGGVIEVRDNHSLRILQREANGRWLIVSEIYMDARTDLTYPGGSPQGSGWRS